MIVQYIDILKVIICSPYKRGEQKDFILNREYGLDADSSSDA